jgi:hypothetical protein
VYDVNMGEPTNTRRGHTRDDLLRYAWAAGHSHVSARLITDWVELGLLDHPARRGLGRGRGTAAEWPEEQLQLFLLELKQRDGGARRVPTLCNVPVALWLHFGDRYVPLRQVRRALKTWATTSVRGTFASQRAARQSAADLIAWLAPGIERSARQKELADQLGAITYRIAQGEPYDLDRLVETVAKAITPLGVEPDTAPTSLAVMYARTLRARISAIARLESVSDDVFLFARTQVQLAEQQYAALQPQLSRRDKDGHLYGERSWQERANNACSDLFTHLGFILLAADQPG